MFPPCLLLAAAAGSNLLVKPKIKHAAFIPFRIVDISSPGEPSAEQDSGAWITVPSTAVLSLVGACHEALHPMCCAE